MRGMAFHEEGRQLSDAGPFVLSSSSFGSTAVLWVYSRGG